MDSIKFNLGSYIPQIRKIAQENHVSASDAVQMMVENLAIMREWYKGAPELNYHELGQKWNKLLSGEKVAQKHEVYMKLKGGQ